MKIDNNYFKYNGTCKPMYELESAPRYLSWPLFCTVIKQALHTTGLLVQAELSEGSKYQWREDECAHARCAEEKQRQWWNLLFCVINLHRDMFIGVSFQHRSL